MAWLAKERDGRLLRRRHSRASLCFNVQRRSLLPLHESGGSARETPATRRPRSRDRKVEIFISNGACKVSGAPPLQVIFMGPPRSNELIFTFYAFIPRASTVRPPRTARLESIPSDHDFGTEHLANGRKIARLPSPPHDHN